MEKYTIGIDFGTEFGRVVILERFPKNFLSSVHPELGQMIHTKLRGKIKNVGETSRGFEQLFDI